MAHKVAARKRIRRAAPVELYAAVFLHPKNKKVSHINWTTFAHTERGARMKFMDGLPDLWPIYARYGWCIRKIKIVDMGGA